MTALVLSSGSGTRKDPPSRERFSFPAPDATLTARHKPETVLHQRRRFQSRFSPFSFSIFTAKILHGETRTRSVQTSKVNARLFSHSVLKWEVLTVQRRLT